MAVTFNTNVSALTAQRYLSAAGEAAGSSLSKLSSGSRVPTAKDDAAGLAIGTKLKAEVAGLQQAGNNAAQAVSLLQIADGALSTTSDILQRMKSLSVQASSGQLSNADRSLLNQEFTNLRSEINRIANITNFNGTTLLNGSTNSVTANVNNIATVSADVNAEGLVSEGVDSISFNGGFSADAVKLEYDSANSTLKLTNLNTGQSDVAAVSATAIAAGQTESVSFNTLGATVTLNDAFDKNISNSLTNAARNITYGAAGGADAADVSNFSVSDFRFNEGSGLTAKDVAGVTFTVTTGGTNGNASTAAATIGGKSFSLGTGVTADLSAAGTYTLTLVDADDNQLDIKFTAAAAINGGFTNAVSAATGINYGTYADVELSDVATISGGAVTGSGTTGAVTFTIQATAFNGTGNIKRSDLNAVAITTTEVGGVITYGNATVAGRTFTAGGTVDFGTTGNKDVIFSDTTGNSFTLRANVTGADTDRNDAVGALTLANADTTSPTVDEESVKLTGITKGSTSTFDFGSIDDATVSFTTTSAASASASIVLNGTTFTATGIDLTTTGNKSITLTNGTGTAATSLTVQFNLTGVLDDGDDLRLEVGELGQVVGANTVTGGSTTFSFKVGTGVSTNDSISFSLNAVTTSQLGLSSATIDTSNNADTAIGLVNAAISTVASRRADVGAAQSRLQFAADSIAVAVENTSSAQSALLDVDVSSEITTFTSKQVLLQAGVSLLAQANQQPSLLLRLLQ